METNDEKDTGRINPTRYFFNPAGGWLSDKSSGINGTSSH